MAFLLVSAIAMLLRVEQTIWLNTEPLMDQWVKYMFNDTLYFQMFLVSKMAQYSRTVMLFPLVNNDFIYLHKLYFSSATCRNYKRKLELKI